MKKDTTKQLPKVLAEEEEEEKEEENIASSASAVEDDISLSVSKTDPIGMAPGAVSGEETPETAANKKMVQWTQNQEIVLFRAICRFKPVGVHKHFRMISIHQMVNDSSVQGDRLSMEEIWNKLRLYYDLEGLEELEGSSLIGEPTTNDDNHINKRLRRGESSQAHNSPRYNSNNHGYGLDSGYNSGVDSDQLDESGEVRFLREFKLPWDDFGDMIVSQGKATQSRDMSANADSDLEEHSLGEIKSEFGVRNSTTETEATEPEVTVTPTTTTTTIKGTAAAVVTTPAPVKRKRGRSMIQKIKRENAIAPVADSEEIAGDTKRPSGVGEKEDKKADINSDEDADKEDNSEDIDNTDTSDVENLETMKAIKEKAENEDEENEEGHDKENEEEKDEEEDQDKSSSEGNISSTSGSPTAKKRKITATTFRSMRGGNKTRGISTGPTTTEPAKATGARSKPTTKATAAISKTSRTTRASTRASNKVEPIKKKAVSDGRRKRGVKSAETETGGDDNDDNNDDDEGNNNNNDNANDDDDQVSDIGTASSFLGSPADQTDITESEQLGELSALETSTNAARIPKSTSVPTRTITTEGMESVTTTPAPRRRGRLPAAEKERRELEKRALEESNKANESKARAGEAASEAESEAITAANANESTAPATTKPGRGRPPSTRRSTRKK